MSSNEAENEPDLEKGYSENIDETQFDIVGDESSVPAITGVDSDINSDNQTTGEPNNEPVTTILTIDESSPPCDQCSTTRPLLVNEKEKGNNHRPSSEWTRTEEAEERDEFIGSITMRNGRESISKR